MPRDLRLYRPELFYEVTSMIACCRYFLRPCEESTKVILGVIGRALELYPAIKVYAVNPLSTHWTELISSSDPEQIKGYLAFVKTNVAKELRRLHGIPWFIPFWERSRARVIPTHPSPASVETRWRYVASQGTKEGLVESPRHWQGVTGVMALESNKPLLGRWHNRTDEGRARRRRKKVNPEDFIRWIPVRISPLPHWEELPEAQWRRRVSEIIDDITEKAAAERNGKPVLGYEAVAAMSPMHQGEPSEQTPAPRVHAVGKRAFDQMRELLANFTNAFRAEAERLKRTPDATPSYPPFAFPPQQPMTPGTPLPFAFWAS